MSPYEHAFYPIRLYRVLFMANIILKPKPDAAQCLDMMKQDAAFEVSCDADAEDTAVRCAGAVSSGRAACRVSKLYLAGKCINNCSYCGCRCSREDEDFSPRTDSASGIKPHMKSYLLSPRELAELAVAEAASCGRGVFLSSAIDGSANETQERLAEAARIMRQELYYDGYLHCKVMPGADPELIERTGRYSSRLSVNIEVASSSGYALIARDKSREKILRPMGIISQKIECARYERRAFATSETTQLMAGAIGEDDRTILTLADALYKKYKLRRVYYTAYSYRHEAAGYENLSLRQTPYWRMSRLYQADRLISQYGFTPDDITPDREGETNLFEDIDPKAAWALRHLDMFPVEVNRADFETLIRVPGIGITYARRIMEARRYAPVTHELMKRLHISMKRCIWLITCNGVYHGGGALDSETLRGNLTSNVSPAAEGGVISSSLADKRRVEQLPLPDIII